MHSSHWEELDSGSYFVVVVVAAAVAVEGAFQAAHPVAAAAVAAEAVAAEAVAAEAEGADEDEKPEIYIKKP